MPKLRIKRFHHRNGKVYAENRQIGGQLHGLNRGWYHNGQLAEELRYRHGRMHGTSRQWDASGRLLGSFTMRDGTGLQRYWHDNGQLRLEIASVDGKFHGRTRIWLRDGTLISEKFYIGYMDATRGAYLKAARKNPNWPQYAGEPAGRVAREGTSLQRRQFELFVASILAMRRAEARQWLEAVADSNQHSLARFRTAKAALQLVETLYAAGAEKVFAALIYSGKRGKQFADRLVIKLPKTSSKRKALRQICRNLCAKRGGAWLPDEKDLGESHLLVNLE